MFCESSDSLGRAWEEEDNRAEAPCCPGRGAPALCSPFLDFRKRSVEPGFTPLSGERKGTHPCGDALLLQIISRLSVWILEIFTNTRFCHHFSLSHFSRPFAWSLLLMLPLPRESQLSEHYLCKILNSALTGQGQLHLLF